MAEMDIQYIIIISIHQVILDGCHKYIYTEKQWEPLRMQRKICITFSENRDSFFFSEVPAEKQMQLYVSPNNHTHAHTHAHTYFHPSKSGINEALSEFP